MLLLTLRSLVAHRRRLVSTVLAVVLGVAFLSGSRVFTDTMHASLSGVLVDGERGTDVLVRGPVQYTTEQGQVRTPLDAALVARLGAVPGVAAVAPRLQGYAQVTAHDGGPAVDLSSGAAAVGQLWSDDAALNPFSVVAGSAPAGADEVVVDQRTARTAHLAPGDRTTLVTHAAPRTVTVAGVARFGDADSRAGATTVLLPAPLAQQVLGQPGTVDAVALRAAPGTSQQDLARAVGAAVGTQAETLTGTALAAESAARSNSDVDFFSTFITVFAVVALLVAALLINNTFSIVVAQRVRELALVRALGASRRQVRRSVALEALAVGALASAVGVGAGVGVATGLQALMRVADLPLPEGPLAVRGSSLLLAFALGVVLTVVSALVPARKASRVAPVAAMRDVATGRTTPSAVRVAVGVVVVAAGAAGVVGGILGSAVPPVMLGALAVLLGVAVLGPVVVVPVVRLLALPLPAARGVRGAMARENALRNPRRSAATASALMVGVSLVAAITCFVASGRASIPASFSDSFRGTLGIDTGAWMDGGVSPELAAQLEHEPQVEAVAAHRLAYAQLAGATTELAGWSSGVSRVFDVRVRSGSVSALGSDGVAVAEDLARERGWHVGQVVPLRLGAAQRDVRVAAVYEKSDLLGRAFVDRDLFAQALPASLDTAVYVTTRGDAAAARAAVTRTAAAYPGAVVLDREELAEASVAFFGTLLAVVYALLALAVLIALIGIANTVGLSVLERTRELGMLRAVGMQRSQLRSVVRWEAALVSAFGAVVGLGVGTFLGWAMVFAVSRSGSQATFVVPWGQLAVIAAVASAAGVVAALLPARRAARLDVLQAVATV